MKLKYSDYEKRIELLKKSKLRNEVVDVLNTLIIQDGFKFYLIKHRDNDFLHTTEHEFEWVDAVDIIKQFPICYGGEIGENINNIVIRSIQYRYNGKKLVVKI